MQETFDEEELQPVEHQRDTELTLGPMLLLGLFFGLVLLCGLSFGLGYSIGSHGARESSATSQQPGAAASSPDAGSLPKPSAAPQNIAHSQGAVSGQPSSDGSSAAAENPGSTSVADGGIVQPVVKPALPAAVTVPAPVSAQSAPALMVQIAAVSHREDAEVLVGALRKRGYAVAIHRDPIDNLLHVQVGPFSSRSEANATRQKLLNDGYNAIVQP
jgi:cell division septation protein DedD